MSQRVKRLVPIRPGDAVAQGPREESPLLSQEQAAKRLGVGKRTIRAWIADGTLFSIPVGISGRCRKIPVAELEKFRNGRYDQRPS